MAWFPLNGLDLNKTRRRFRTSPKATQNSRGFRSDLLQTVALWDVDNGSDLQVSEDTEVHALVLVTHIQQSCYDLHWIGLQAFQLLQGHHRNSFNCIYQHFKGGNQFHLHEARQYGTGRLSVWCCRCVCLTVMVYMIFSVLKKGYSAENFWKPPFTIWTGCRLTLARASAHSTALSAKPGKW